MTLRVFELPLTAEPQSFSVSLGGITYKLRFTWCPPAACWMMDIADALGNMLATALPMVTGLDVLKQYEHLGIPGAIIVQTDNAPDEVPNFDNLGSRGHVYFVSVG